MNRMIAWMSLATALGMSTLAVAGGTAQNTRAPAFDCGQTQQVGTAADDYATLAACNNAKRALQDSAVADGNRQCTALCDAMGCTATTVPARLTATASCKADAAQNGYGVATTGSFDCKCSK